MTISFHDLVPTAGPWVESLSRLPIIALANETVWIFAVIEAAHLLFLAIIGGAVLALDLRLLDLALTGVPAIEVERRTRPWLHFGVVGGLATGLIMGVLNAATLYRSEAFFIKMAALVAAILFSYAVVRRIARNEGAPPLTVIAASIAALVLLGFALFAFSTAPGVQPGVILIVIAAVALLAVASKRHRALLLGGTASILIVGWLADLLLPYIDAAPWALLERVSFLALAALFALGVGAFELRTHTLSGGRTAKAAAFISVIGWVTVATAGRWIGFS